MSGRRCGVTQVSWDLGPNSRPECGLFLTKGHTEGGGGGNGSTRDSLPETE